MASHHDSWHKGAARPGIGHAVLMELAKTLSYEYIHGWRPGRSIIFASWDGEEMGQLGSTYWLYSHAKELSSRAVVYVDLDYLLQGSDKIHITSSPLLKYVKDTNPIFDQCSTQFCLFQASGNGCSLVNRQSKSAFFKLAQFFLSDLI